MITIVDYGMGNLRSVQKAFERVGTSARIVTRPDEIEAAEKLVLPGVGAFGDAMDELRSRELIRPIRDFIASARPFLGICLGLQLLFESSEERGNFPGLGVLRGRCRRFEIPLEFKVPHMGWNQARVVSPNSLTEPEGTVAVHYYFVHSYYVEPADSRIVALETSYPQPFCSMIRVDNIYATQFHPEKSQSAGLRMLARFAEL